MKNILPVLFGIALLIASAIYISKAEAIKKAALYVPETYDSETEEGCGWNLKEPLLIVSPDFRNINWDMDFYSIACQEMRLPDDVKDDYMLFENTKFSVFENSELYYFSSETGCRSAAYKITVNRDEPQFNTAEKIIAMYLDEMYAPADENEPSVRYTYPAVIRYSEDIGEERKIFIIRFDMPEKYLDNNNVTRTMVWA